MRQSPASSAISGQVCRMDGIIALFCCAQQWQDAEKPCHWNKTVVWFI
jgi:hypothetical protein